MTTKNELIKNYKEAQKEFAGMIVPDETTPKPIALQLERDYNNYVEWFRAVEEEARNQGWYNELVKK